MERIQQILVDKGYFIGTSGINKDGVDGKPGKLTLGALTNYIKDLCKENNYIFFQKNLYWFRTSDVFTDKFSDFVVVVVAGQAVEVANATTKPGKYYVYNPVTAGGITGTGCRVAGQTFSSHRFIAKGKSKWGGEKVGYFQQISNLLIYRDGNKDDKLDKKITQVAPTKFGFFLHAMGRGFSIWNWSAGCMGTPLDQWLKKIVPYFSDNDVINDTIFEV